MECFSNENEGILSRGEVATGEWDPRSEPMRGGQATGMTGSHYRASIGLLGDFWVRRAGERKERRFLEPDEILRGQVAARRKGMSSCRRLTCLHKDYASARASLRPRPATSQGHEACMKPEA